MQKSQAPNIYTETRLVESTLLYKSKYKALDFSGEICYHTTVRRGKWLFKCKRCGGTIFQVYESYTCINCGWEKVTKVHFYPMLAKLAREPFDSPNHIFERKCDGIRGIVYKENCSHTLINRSNIDITKRFPELDIQTTDDCTLDTEVVCKSFQAMQTRANRLIDIERAARDNPAKLVVFDVLEKGGHILTDMPLIDRKTVLQDLVIPTDTVEVIDFVDTYGKDYFAQAEELNWEGIMAKKMSSCYMPGRRTDNWLKIKVRHSMTVDIVGATVGLGKRRDTFGALVVANNCVLCGEVGTGFTDEELEHLDNLMKIVSNPIPRAGWKYEIPLGLLKCKVSYAEMTNDNQMRFPVFETMMVD